MGTPFYRSKKFVNRTAAALGILAIIIFISANMLSIHAYRIHPTPTQTPTFTATITKTPRPSITPTITTTSTPSLTPTSTPTLFPELEQIDEIMQVFTEKGYTCTYTQVGQNSLYLDCDGKVETYSLQFRLLFPNGALSDMLIVLEPYSATLPENLMAELTWLLQTPFRYSWLMDIQTIAASPVNITETQISSPTLAPQTTPSATPTIDNVIMETLSTWLQQNLPILSADTEAQYNIGNFVYTLKVTDNSLAIECKPLIE